MSKALPTYPQRPRRHARLLEAILALIFGTGMVPLARTATQPPTRIGASSIQHTNSTYRQTPLSQVLSNRALAMKLAENTRRTIVPTMHLVETEHFLIFSAWNVSNDTALAVLCEQMFQKLAQQFNIPGSESVWVGKCPIYLFWEPAHYARFIAEVDQSQKLDPNMAHANGYHASREEFSYVVINGVAAFGANQEQAKIKFYHVLVHEGPHAFLHRYLSERPMPLWMEEGLAEYVAACLVPQSAANRDYLTATRTALRSAENVRHLLGKKDDLTATEYGVAQSLVRFLVAQDRVAMIRFVELLKKGKSEEAALADAYHISNAQLIRGWALFWQHALARQT